MKILISLGANISFIVELAIFALLKGSFPKFPRNCRDWHKGFWLGIYYFVSVSFHLFGFCIVSSLVSCSHLLRGMFHKIYYKLELGLNWEHFISLRRQGSLNTALRKKLLRYVLWTQPSATTQQYLQEPTVGGLCSVTSSSCWLSCSPRPTCSSSQHSCWSSSSRTV